MQLLSLVRAWARRKNATPARISLAWLLAQKSYIVPIPGTAKLHHVQENIGALDIKFTQNELSELRDAFSKIELTEMQKAQSAMTNL